MRMSHSTIACRCALLWVAAALAGVAWPSPSLRAADEINFSRQILPILSANCFACHGPDEKSREAELRLDTAEGAFEERDGAAPIRAGDPANSEIWKRIISTDPDQVMPPPDSRKQLKDQEKELIKAWIEQGAKYQKHWAFVPPVRPAEPAVKDQAWSKNAIDRFLLAELEKAGITPRPEANRHSLIRRAAFALTGLPPTPDEVARFVNDSSPHAYEEMIQRYLDSPRFGEEMARHWLDVARYADTHGLHLDNEREMWAYRDWVIKAFNQNLPFDQFTVDQLAGDQLPNPTQDQLIATGFNRCNVTTSEGGSIEAEFQYRYAVDRTSTMVQAWMGLTGGCAVCHDHKYDPLTMREFYSLYAFFYSAADPAMDRNVRDTDPFLSLATAEQKAELERFQQEENRTRQVVEELAANATVADPGDAESPPAKQPFEELWLDDDFPLGAKVTSTSRNAPTWVLAQSMDLPRGKRALRQAGASTYQDKFENFALSWIIPEQAKIRVSVFLDPHEPPQTIMLELQTSKGTRRAIWGAVDRLGSGQEGTPERLRIGDLPSKGQWHELEVSADQWQLPAGEFVRGVALAEYGGIACWDAVRVQGEWSPAQDPRVSFKAWWKDRAGKDTPNVPGDLAGVLKDGPEKEVAPELRDRLRSFFLAHIARPLTPELQAARAAFDDARVNRLSLDQTIPGTFIFRDLDKPRDAFVMLRGQYDKPGDKVEPAVPTVFPPLQKDDPARRANRLDLARWLVSPEHPLTARVAVNRVWQQFFGTGLVKTSYDFGAQGEPPSHPELLDWLAVQYRESGWNTKELVRLMVTSSAFRQDAKVVPETAQRDPENRLHGRGPRIRLDAEQIRDNALAVSGLLNLAMGGPGVRPYQPPNIWEPVGYADSNTRFYLQDHGAALYRRSVYCFLKRTAPPPFMSNFDGPNREQFCARRERSNTPLQALQLMNDVQQFEAARVFAQRMLREGGATPDERLTFAYRIALSRSPSADELAIVKQTLEKYLGRYRANEEAARRVTRVGEAPVAEDLPAVDLAAYTLIANLILNLDETVTRN